MRSLLKYGINHAEMIIYCLDLCSYCRETPPCEDAPVRNELDLAMELIQTYAPRNGSPLILFLTAPAAFKETLKVVPLETWNQNYDGGADFDTALEFIRSHIRDSIRSDRIYMHIVDVVDEHSMPFVFRACRDIVLHSQLVAV